MAVFDDLQSVILVYGLSSDEFEVSLQPQNNLQTSHQTFGIQYQYFNDVNQYKEAVHDANHLIALVVNQLDPESEFCEWLTKFQSQLMVIGAKQDEFPSLQGALFCDKQPNQDEFTQTFQPIYQQLIQSHHHPDLGGWMSKCASFLMPFHVTSGTIAFQEGDFTLIENFEYFQMNMELEPFVGTVLMGVDMEIFQKEIGNQLGLDKTLSRDFLTELLNQFAGVLTRPFFNHFNNPHVKPPLCLTYEEAKQLCSQVHLPFSTIVDQLGFFNFHLAIIHRSGGKPFKASMDAAWDPIQTLEFL